MTGILNLLAGAVGVVKDTYFNLVTLLLPGDGTNGAQNNTFLDSSTNNFTITRNGNTTQGTFSPFSQTGWSNAFNGSSDYLSITATSALQLDNATAFTIEFWVYPNSIPASGSSAFVLRAYNLSSPFQGYGIAFGGNALNTNLQFWDGTAWADIGTVSANQWTHVAITYTGSGTTRRYFINGVQQGSAATVPSSINWTGTGFIVGARNADMYFNGYISNLRILKGTAQYTAAFTPPTSALTAITNTSLLTCQSNRFVDNSANAYAITITGTPSVQAFSPFAPTAAYSAATNGGSGYFDGSGDYLSVSNAAFNFSATDFTIEFWFYNNGTTGSDVMLFQWGSGASGDIQFVINQGGTTGNIALGTSGQAKTATATTRYGWNHIAGVKSGTTYYTYVNGVRNTTQSGGSPSTSTSFNIFNGVLGYISGLKISNTAVYTGTTLTVPTSPPTSDANTQLLANFTNAGITDATAKNVLETVGNAQISTTQSKFGGSSMYFDGTGDRLKIPYNPNLLFLSGDFTVEMWVYKSANNAYMTACGNLASAATAAWSIIGDATGNKITWYSNSAFVLESTTSLATSTWYHVAVARSGTTIRLFINGTQEASATNSTNYNVTNDVIVGQDNQLISARDWNGYIDDLRITKGYARYTANFTAPTAAFALQ